MEAAVALPPVAPPAMKPAPVEPPATEPQLAKEPPAVAPMPSRPRVVRVLHAWDNTASGQGYLSLRRGELLQCLPPPEEPEGWGYGAVTQQYCAGCWQDLAKDVGSVGGGADRVGWFPPAFVAELEDF